MGVFDVKVDGGLFSGIGEGISSIINSIKGQLPPEKAAEVELRGKELENQLLIGQMEINKIEAGSSNVFIAGWRPGLAWVFVVVIALHYLIRPVVEWYFTIKGIQMKLPDFDLAAIWPILLGILGLGTLRTVEKSQGVQGKH